MREELHCADEDVKGTYVCAVPVPSVLTVHVASPTVSTVTCVSHATSGRHPVWFLQQVCVECSQEWPRLVVEPLP